MICIVVFGDSGKDLYGTASDKVRKRNGEMNLIMHRNGRAFYFYFRTFDVTLDELTVIGRNTKSSIGTGSRDWEH